MHDNRVAILNHLGLAFRDLNQLDSSDRCFMENLKIVEGAYVGITKGNLGENQYLRRNYDAALPLLQADADMALELKDYHLASNALMLIGDIYSRKGNYPKADSILSIGLKLLRNTNSFPKRKKGFSIMERFYINTHQNQLAALFQDSVLYVSDSLTRYYNKLQVSSAEAGFEFQNLREKTQDELTALELSRQKRTGLAVIFCLLAVIVYLFLQRRLASARLRETDLKLLQQSTEEELQASRKELE
jgi:tetratricopeptide (TPR) repeat protein